MQKPKHFGKRTKLQDPNYVISKLSKKYSCDNGYSQQKKKKNLHRIIDLNVTAKTMKLLEGIGENLCDLELGKHNP